MPWTATELKILSLGNSKTKIISVAGDRFQESLMEPHWDENHLKLYALSDKQGAWNPVSFEFSKTKEDLKIKRKDFPSCPAEIGMPAWQLSQNSLHILAEDEFLGRSLSQGVGKIWHFEKRHGWQEITSIFPSFIPEPLKNGDFCCLNAAADLPASILTFSFSEKGKIEKKKTIRSAWNFPKNFSRKELSTPQMIEIPLLDAFSPLRVLYYPAASKTLLRENKPPLIVKVHGGPTGSAQGALDLRIQYWTSRGFAVLEVDYRGSAGYGRAYREALNGEWGVLDVKDCCLATQSLLDQNLADSQRCVIRGSSAGGLTALAALSLENSPFKAACSLYGVTDLSALVGGGPRFEAHYVEKLVGKYPEKKAIYKKRSPLSWPERLQAPVLFLHGGQDRVVPVTQAQRLAAQLPKAQFHLYPEAGHGFRDPEIIMDALDRERHFYQKVFKQALQESEDADCE
ncbi:S9 family peptidase [Acetobacteraceae bacterium]|nr:S9 family peptidase [Acetobacteraceae bacterium]